MSGPDRLDNRWAMPERPAPEVFTTSADDTRHHAEEPISVRFYTDARNSTVVRMTAEEAGKLMARLMVWAAKEDGLV